MSKSNRLFDFSEPIAIYSGSKISKEELSDFLCSIGAVVRENNSFLGRLSEGNKHVWIYISNEELDYLDTADREAIIHYLNDEPETCIVLELSTTAGSEQLLTKFAIAFAQRWSCVVSCFAEDNEVCTVQQLRNSLEPKT